jgi:hypothetical protein
MKFMMENALFPHSVLLTPRAACRAPSIILARRAIAQRRLAHSSLLAALTLCLASAGAARAQSQIAPPASAPPVSPVTNSVATTGDEIIPRVVFNGVPLRNAITALAKQTGPSVSFDPALPLQIDPDVTVKWANVTARQALEVLLDNYDWQMTQDPHSAVRISARDPNAMGPPWMVVNLLENSPTNGAPANGATSVLPLISFTTVPRSEAIEALAFQAGLNLQFDRALLQQKAADGTSICAARLTEKWQQLTARQALQALLDQWGWQLTQIPGNPIFRIGLRNP